MKFARDVTELLASLWDDYVDWVRYRPILRHPAVWTGAVVAAALILEVTS